MDLLTLVISIVGIIGGLLIIFQLRRQKLAVALGIGGSVVLLGLVLLAIVYQLISGPGVWFVTVLVLAILATGFYIAEKGKRAPK